MIEHLCSHVSSPSARALPALPPHPLGCAVSSFPTPKDEGGITGVPEGGGSAVDECGPAVTSGHFNPTLT